MSKWIKHLETPLPKAPRAPDRPKKWVKPMHVRMPAAGTIALRAFWLMHVDAQQASGLSATEYGNVHRLNVRRLRREVREFLRNPEAPNWRELMHPSNRPPGRYGAPTSNKLSKNLCITSAAEASVQLTKAGAPRQRRQYSEQEKLAMVLEWYESGSSGEEVAKRHGVNQSMLWRWSKQFKVNPKEFSLLAPAHILDSAQRGRPKAAPPILVPNLLPQPPGTMLVKLPDGRSVFAPEGSDPDVVRRYIEAHKERSP